MICQKKKLNISYELFKKNKLNAILIHQFYKTLTFDPSISKTEFAILLFYNPSGIFRSPTIFYDVVYLTIIKLTPIFFSLYQDLNLNLQLLCPNSKQCYPTFKTQN